MKIEIAFAEQYKTRQEIIRMEEKISDMIGDFLHNEHKHLDQEFVVRVENELPYIYTVEEQTLPYTDEEKIKLCLKKVEEKLENGDACTVDEIYNVCTPICEHDTVLTLQAISEIYKLYKNYFV